MTDLAKLVGEEAEHIWYSLPYKKLFYKDGEPYGMIGINVDEDMAMVYSMAKDNGDFTVGMLKMIIGIYNKMNITLITDNEASFAKIEKTLRPYGFECFVITNELGWKFLYSIHFKED